MSLTRGAILRCLMRNCKIASCRARPSGTELARDYHRSRDHIHIEWNAQNGKRINAIPRKHDQQSSDPRPDSFRRPFLGRWQREPGMRFRTHISDPPQKLCPLLLHVCYFVKFLDHMVAVSIFASRLVLGRARFSSLSFR